MYCTFFKVVIMSVDYGFFFPDYSPVEHETKKYIDYFPVKQEGNKPKQKQTQRLTPPHTTPPNTTKKKKLPQ